MKTINNYLTFLLIATLVTGSFMTKAQSVGAINFDGSNDSIVLANESSFDFTTQMTVEAWVKVSPASSQYSRFVDKMQWLSQTGWMLMRDPIAGGFVFHINGSSGGGCGSTVSVTDNQWHHMAATFSNGLICLYFDGVLNNSLSTGIPSIITTNNKSVTIGYGHDQLNPYFIAGSMDEIRIWNVARSASEIYNGRCGLSSFPSSLVAYYQCNQGVANGNNAGVTTLTDATTNSINGTLYNFGLNGTTSNWVAGFIGACAIPTLSQWGLILLSLLMICFGVFHLKKKVVVPVELRF